ncbi:Sporulation related domain-containing protein [Nitrosospira sp. Nl5]|uniref:SPOR domain-containing protein n=1 Tax=Nitrosospira sp. Nl5 TaxID=200120 RepID=UPI0008815BB0|nr:SPOR domain-containing protein [Nitrosospira sp. Nl5]SCY52948.1 Sporulation related domain-containing protein [Nitrosospira sp. Nl5]
MRTLFFLLLLTNAAFAAYMLSRPGPGAGTPPQLELRSEKVKPLPAPATCLEWGTFLDADMERVEAVIAAQQLGNQVTRQAMGKVPVYWVHIPPLGSKSRAEQKIGELKRLGITDHSQVQDGGKWDNAISMGFFQEIDEARNLLTSLRSKGVRSAIIGARNVEQVKFVVPAPSEDVTRKMMELKREFPGSELNTTTCEHAAEFEESK